MDFSKKKADLVEFSTKIDWSFCPYHAYTFLAPKKVMN